MNTFVRTGIITVATTVGLGTAGFAVASAAPSQDPVVKREDTSSSWVQSTHLDDDDLRDDVDDSPTVNTLPTGSTAPTAQTVSTTTNHTVKTVASTPTRNTVTTGVTGR